MHKATALMVQLQGSGDRTHDAPQRLAGTLLFFAPPAQRSTAAAWSNPPAHLCNAVDSCSLLVQFQQPELTQRVLLRWDGEAIAYRVQQAG